MMPRRRPSGGLASPTQSSTWWPHHHHHIHRHNVQASPPTSSTLMPQDSMEVPCAQAWSTPLPMEAPPVVIRVGGQILPTLPIHRASPNTRPTSARAAVPNSSASSPCLPPRMDVSAPRTPYLLGEATPRPVSPLSGLQVRVGVAASGQLPMRSPFLQSSSTWSSANFNNSRTAADSPLPHKSPAPLDSGSGTECSPPRTAQNQPTPPNNVILGKATQPLMSYTHHPYSSGCLVTSPPPPPTTPPDATHNQNAATQGDMPPQAHTPPQAMAVPRNHHDFRSTNGVAPQQAQGEEGPVHYEEPVMTNNHHYPQQQQQQQPHQMQQNMRGLGNMGRGGYGSGRGGGGGGGMRPMYRGHPQQQHMRQQMRRGGQQPGWSMNGRGGGGGRYPGRTFGEAYNNNNNRGYDYDGYGQQAPISQDFSSQNSTPYHNQPPPPPISTMAGGYDHDVRAYPPNGYDGTYAPQDGGSFMHNGPPQYDTSGGMNYGHHDGSPQSQQHMQSYASYEQQQPASYVNTTYNDASGGMMDGTNHNRGDDVRYGGVEAQQGSQWPSRGRMMHSDRRRQPRGRRFDPNYNNNRQPWQGEQISSSYNNNNFNNCNEDPLATATASDHPSSSSHHNTSQPLLPSSAPASPDMAEPVGTC